MSILIMLFLFFLFLCWGSFLNSLGYRLIHEINLLIPRSFCPHCTQLIAWYDNIPLLSWFLLQGHCRTCKQAISWLYPFIELITATSLTALALKASPAYFPAYFFFFSALIITIRTDIETMLISRFVTLFITPLGWLLAFGDYLPLPWWHSLLGSFIGYGFLYLLATLFKWLSGKEGMGEGDFELLAFIGAFVGPFGCWITLFMSSILGCIAGLLYYFIARPTETLRIPYGPFLASTAMIYVLYSDYLLEVVLGI